MYGMLCLLACLHMYGMWCLHAFSYMCMACVVQGEAVPVLGPVHVLQHTHGRQPGGPGNTGRPAGPSGSHVRALCTGDSPPAPWALEGLLPGTAVMPTGKGRVLHCTNQITTGLVDYMSTVYCTVYWFVTSGITVP